MKSANNTPSQTTNAPEAPVATAWSMTTPINTGTSASPAWCDAANKAPGTVSLRWSINARPSNDRPVTLPAATRHLPS